MNAIWDILSAHPEANLVGGVCVVLGFAWPLYKTRRSILLGQAGLHIAFTLHFFMLDALSATFMNLIGLAQVLAAIPLGKTPGFKYLYIAILPVIAAGAYLTWHGPSSAFIAVAFAFMSLARYQSDTLNMRVLMIATISFAAAHDYLVLSLPALSTDVLSMTTSLIMIRGELRRRRVAATL
jgi:hypothetical protein